ncbi:hypothetical protein N9816_04605 [Gammaproteobacteria bacterium]|nr:hypothetical protein [Gammaproteobacteria bacterium]
MQWKKMGLVFDASKFSWSKDTALQPTPLAMGDRIRVFVGSRDASGVSRIGFVDLDKNDPLQILDFSKKPVLDVGCDGSFDESGVVPSAVVRQGSLIYLFYAGYQLGSKVRFSVLGGLAISDDGGATFNRVQSTPVFERTPNETLFRVPHTVLFEDNKWKAWYGGGSKFVHGQVKSLPVYDVRYTESKTPFSFQSEGRSVLTTQGEEYRLGRPFLFKKNHGEYYLFYGFSTEQKPYRLGYATSSDLKNWTRRDASLNLDIDPDDWESEMTAYPAVIASNEKVFMFYNGNGYGQEGFGMAELIKW